MTRYKAFSKHPTGIDIPFRARSLSGNLDGAFLFFLFSFFFSKFRRRKKGRNPLGGINHRDEHSVYAKIEHLEIKQSGQGETEWRCEF